MKLLVKNAHLIPVSGDRPPAFMGWMTVSQDGRIAAIGEGEVPAGVTADETLDADGAFVAPGFVSAHSHLATSGSRGLGHEHSLYTWADHMSRYVRHTDENDIYWLTLHGSLDVLSNGITTAYDFTESRLNWIMVDGKRQQLGDLKPAAFASEQIRAKMDSGLRFVNSAHINDQIGTDEEIYARFEETLDYFNACDRDKALRFAISGAVQWSDTPETARREVELMRRHGVLNQPHFLETSEHLELQRKKFAWYDEAGALGPDLLFGHFVHPTHHMKCRCAECNVGMVWQPTANGRLASGFADIPGLLELGMRVGVGVDDQSCTDVADPFQNMRMGIYTQRAHNRDPKAMGVPQMLYLHTMGSATTLGLQDRIGSLEPGKFADFLIVDPRQPDLGPLWDPVATYVLACTLRNLKSVWVGGTCVDENGISKNPLARPASRELHGRLGRIAREQEGFVPADARA